ncbi:error-prone DNA polymerase [Alteromonas mediterranea]|uniref:error-prone DNA polymerase n=1 Tax=Alteromonas mediterranea TaxID=314275 RepID=UPI0009040236|nr:error-prone DNA polymerase [Alteromonas mediterranea]APD92538.1 error-prone DNA polymerase [Alteromonas mediterranea]APD96152.1 error-prone DNA polymerase [Alteromonas mediterranea]
MKYSELFCQSHYSFLCGASSPAELVTTASFLGYEAIAITDECSVAGVVRAFDEITHQGLPIKLIVGSYFIFDKTLSFVLLCPNKAAYSELCRIITNARRRSEKGEYQLAEWDLRTIRHCKFIWLPSGEVNEDKYWAQWLQKHPNIDAFIGAQRLLDGRDHHRFAHYNHLQSTYAFPVIACTGALMHHADRLPLQHILHATKVHTSVHEIGREALSNAERSLRTTHKIKKLYPEKWLANTHSLAQQFTFSLEELRYQYPAELVPEGYTPTSYLRERVEEGIKIRFPEGITPEIRQTIEKELRLIAEQEYEYFFLTIYDIVQFAKQQRILYQGRGSAANSVVCYCLEITAVDPRQISVLFERFISKERNEPPDIDVDFEHQRREEVIQYIYKKYGRERTAIAATVICYRFKSAFKDVGKALGFSESQLDFVVKQINRRDSVIPWKSQLADLGLNPEEKRVQQLISLTEALLGTPRHLSQHVGGFVISAGPLYDLVPVENAAMEARTIIQWDKDDIETLGLLKVDVLALGMLSAIRRAFSLINKQYPVETSIPFITKLGDDKQVFDMICRADTVGVFQIESRAQMSMLPRLKPRRYYDLVVQIAIVRPGPIQGDMVHPYLIRRHGNETISYPSKEVEKVLSRTMGVPIFQEQVIQLAMVAAGFSGGEADQLRRAMASWKKDGRIFEFRDKLIKGMTNKGYDSTFAHNLFEQIKGFAGYGFPESHSASFAVLAYVSCWLKFYFPVEFYVALLNSWPMGFYTPSQLVQDAKRHNIYVEAPCVNKSDTEHTLVTKGEDKYIQLGLKLIKGLSEVASHKIVKNRPATGYTHIEQIQHLSIKSNELEALASADAFRTISGNRYETRWRIMDTQTRLPLFDTVEENTKQGYSPLKNKPSDAQNLLEDYASTSLSVNNHPISLLKRQHKLNDISWSNTLINKKNKSVVKVLGAVTGRQAPGTAAGVTFLTLEDDIGNINVVVWQATARAQQKTFLKAKLLQVNGIIERSKEGVIHIIAGKLIDRTPWLESISLNSRDFH